MQFFSLLSLLLFVPFVLAADPPTDPPTELQIETTFAPAECVQKAQSGDRIKVHYVCPPPLCPALRFSRLVRAWLACTFVECAP